MKQNILIFGDSYSTFRGYIPEGYGAYYDESSGEEYGISDVSQTWWHMFASEMDMDIVLNDSWSGATICNTGYSGDCSKTSSFIFRLSRLIENGFFDKNRIDRVLVFGGTNDSWTENACGELMFSDWTEADLRLVLPGISYFIDKLLSVVSCEKVHMVINNELRDDVTNGMKAIADHYNVKYTALSDLEKVNGHPTYKGMTQIKDQIIANIK